MGGALTWLGHAAFRLDTPSGARVYVDPFLTGNPRCPPGEREPERCDLILLTHGHGDHVGDTVALHRRHGCPVVAQVELRGWLTEQGVADDGMAHSLNKGGSTTVLGVTVTLTDANHSSSGPDGRYLGEPCGLVLAADGMPTVYVAGDTNVFGDMALDPAPVRAGGRRPADRRPLHDGPARGGAGSGAGRSAQGGAVALGDVPRAHRDAGGPATPPARGGRARRSRARRGGDAVNERWHVVALDDVPGFADEGRPRWHMVRSALGIEAFGVNAWTATTDGQEVIARARRARGGGRAATRSSTSCSRAAPASRSTSETVDAPAGTIVHVPDPSRAAIGGRRTAARPSSRSAPPAARPFAVSSWERSAEALRFWETGDWEAAIDVLQGQLVRDPDNAGRPLQPGVRRGARGPARRCARPPDRGGATRAALRWPTRRATTISPRSATTRASPPPASARTRGAPSTPRLRAGAGRPRARARPAPGRAPAGRRRTTAPGSGPASAPTSSSSADGERERLVRLGAAERHELLRTRTAGEHVAVRDGAHRHVGDERPPVGRRDRDRDAGSSRSAAGRRPGAADAAVRSPSRARRGRPPRDVAPSRRAPPSGSSARRRRAARSAAARLEQRRRRSRRASRYPSAPHRSSARARASRRVVTGRAPGVERLRREPRRSARDRAPPCRARSAASKCSPEDLDRRRRQTERPSGRGPAQESSRRHRVASTG